MMKIVQENQRILRRIQEVPPAYTHTEWDEHARATDKHRKSISIFPDHPDRNGKDTLSGKESMSGTGTARTSTMEFSTIASNAPKSPPARGAPPAFGFSVYGPLRTISPVGRERERERVRSLSSDGILPHLHNRK